MTLTNAPRSTSAPTRFGSPTTAIVREIPLDFNGYVTVAKPATRIPAIEVRPGDILILDSYVSRVNTVDRIDVQPPYGAWACWIKGDINIIRFGHELVSVLRP